MTITEFLEARIAEDERQATGHIANWEEAGDDTIGQFDAAVRADNEYGWMRVGPARVLAECTAKRAVIAAVRDAWFPSSDDDFDGYEAQGYHEELCDAVFRPMAAVYSDHPDYHEQWVA